MNLRPGGDPPHRVGQRRLDVVLGARIGLQMQQRGDDLQRIADAVVDLAQQHLALGGERGVAVARGVDLGLGVVAGLLNPRLPQRAVDRDLQQRDEIALYVLDQIIGGAGLQRGDGDRGILRGGDEHHRRRARDRHDPFQRLQPVEAGHELIERDDVDAALLQAGQPLGAARGMHHLEAEPRQAAVDQPGEPRIIVDIEQCGHWSGHVAADGTWMTEKNRPSWRMALAKLS